jgi:hypothetical protein
MALLGQLSAALDGKLRYRTIAEKSAIFALTGDDDVTHTLLVQVDEESAMIQLVLKFERKASRPRQEEMCVFMGQANCSTFSVGGVEMDSSTGECQFRHAVDVNGIHVNSEFLRALVVTHIRQGERCWRGVEAIMNGADYRSALSLVS